jgi:hypothetical protein
METKHASIETIDVNAGWWLPPGVEHIDRGNERIARRRERLEQRVLDGQLDPESLLLIPRDIARAAKVIFEERYPFGEPTDW